MRDSDPQNEFDQLAKRVEAAETAAVKLAQENVQISRDLREANSKANLAKELKRSFLANISHELRTPMNGILGMTELLNATSLDDTQTHYAASITRSTESLLNVVNDILDFSSLEQGKIELEETEFFFAKIVKEVCAQFESRAAAKNLKLLCNTESTLHSPVIGDVQRIRQILFNLINNAIKFTDQGEIVITQNTTADGTHSINVSDTGPGIPPSIQSEIFKSFAQGDNSSTRRFGGTGLGLSIASSLANLMGGEITMQSEVGVGSNFTLTCTLKEGNSESIGEVGKNNLKGIKVLVVDDTETNREILELQLQQWDLDVHCADSGAQALDILDKAHAGNTPFKLAILDLNMPNMDGLELAQHIQEAVFSKDLRVMLLTSSTAELSKQALEARGVLKAMMKPARQALLHDAIVKLLENEPRNHRVDIHLNARSTKILLTEDDPINQEVATIMLESLGYEVVVADNGKMAVELLLEDNTIDLVLMDCQMPVMDGFSATEAIRSTNNNIPIIALTANATQGDRDQCLRVGMNDYLTKPIHSKDLSRIVQQWATAPSDCASKNIDKEHSKTNEFTSAEVTSENTMNIEIDETALDAIRSLQRPGKPDILARIVNMYIEKSPELISAITDGVAANDSAKVKMAAHTLKSSSAYVGAPALAEVCNRIEALASADDLASTAEDVEKINSGFESVIQQIKQYG